MKKIISKLGLAISAFAIVFGALSLSSCQKEEIEYNKDIPGGSIVIPGTDLTSIEELLAQIKEYLVKEQQAQLEDLLDKIAGDNEEIKAQLERIVAQIQEEQERDAEIKALLEEVLGKALPSIEEFLSQIKDYLENDQLAQLEKLLDEISGDNAEIKAQLVEIVNQIKEGLSTESDIKVLLEQILKHLEDAHKTDPHSDPHGDPHGHGEGSNAGGGAIGK